MTSPVHSLPEALTPATTRDSDVSPRQSPKGSKVASAIAEATRDIDAFELGLKDAFSKLHKKRHPKPAEPVAMPNPAAPISVVASTPVTERPPVMSPAPGPVLDDPFAQPVFYQARVPAVAVGLVSIKQEIENLIAKSGGNQAVLLNILKVIEGGLEDPSKEAVVVLAEIAKLMCQFVVDETGLRFPGQAA